jgi:hypothetical protein
MSGKARVGCRDGANEFEAKEDGRAEDLEGSGQLKIPAAV